MVIELVKKNEAFQFEAFKAGMGIHIAASPALTGEEVDAFRPMELLLSALGSCMSIDVLSILKKQRQEVEFFQVRIIGDRSSEIPSVFTKIELTMYIRGSIDEHKLKRAISLSEERYCSVHHMLNKSVDIRTKYQLKND